MEDHNNLTKAYQFQNVSAIIISYISILMIFEIIHMPNKILPPSPITPQAKLLRQLGIDSPQHILITHIRPANYFKFAQKILSHLPETTLIVIGNYKEVGIFKWFTKKIKKKKYIRIGDHTYDQKIRHISELHDLDIEHLVNLCKIVIFPGDDLIEGIEKKFLQLCFRHAKPILACQSHKYRDAHLCNYTAQFIPTESDDHWVAWIQHLIQHPMEAQERGQLAKYYIEGLEEAQQVRFSPLLSDNLLNDIDSDPNPLPQIQYIEKKGVIQKSLSSPNP